MSENDIERVHEDFGKAAKMAVRAASTLLKSMPGTAIC